MSQQSKHRAMAGMSRRRALIAGAGVAAGSAAVISGARLSFGGSDADAALPRTNPDEPVILRLTDARRGAFDMYVGTEVVHVVDNGFAARVASAARRVRH